MASRIEMLRARAKELNKSSNFTLTSATKQPSIEAPIESIHLPKIEPSLTLFSEPISTSLPTSPSKQISEIESEIEADTSSESFQNISSHVSEKSSDNSINSNSEKFSSLNLEEKDDLITVKGEELNGKVEATESKESPSSSEPINKVPSANSDRPSSPRATLHPFYSIHDPRNQIPALVQPVTSTPKPISSLTSSKVEEVESPVNVPIHDPKEEIPSLVQPLPSTSTTKANTTAEDLENSVKVPTHDPKEEIPSLVQPLTSTPTTHDPKAEIPALAHPLNNSSSSSIPSTSATAEDESKSKLLKELSEIRERLEVQTKEFERTLNQKNHIEEEFKMIRKNFEDSLRSKDEKERDLKSRYKKKKEKLIELEGRAKASEQLSRDFEDVKDRLNGATSEIVALEYQIQRLEEEAQKDQTLIRQLREELDKLKQDYNELRSHHKILKEESKKQELIASDRVAEIIQIKEELSKQLNQVKSLEKALSRSEADETELYGRIERVEEDKRQFEKVIEAVKSEKRSLEAEKEQLMNRIKSLENSLSQSQANHQRAEQGLRETIALKNSLAAASSALRHELHQIAKNKSQKDQEDDEQKRKNLESKVSEEREVSLKIASDAEIVILKAKISDLEREKEERNSLVDELLEALEETEAKNVELEARAAGTTYSKNSKVEEAQPLNQTSNSATTISESKKVEENLPVPSSTITLPPPPLDELKIKSNIESEFSKSIPDNIEQKEKVVEPEVPKTPTSAKSPIPHLTLPTEPKTTEEVEKKEIPLVEEEISPPTTPTDKQNRTRRSPSIASNVTSTSSYASESNRSSDAQLEVDELLKLTDMTIKRNNLWDRSGSTTSIPFNFDSLTETNV